MEEVERLCRYLSNDSLVRWATGASQADVERARANIAKARRPGFAYLPERHRANDLTAEMTLREKRADKANRRYLAAIRRARANG